MTPRRVLFASLIGTTIEYFDFYVYGTAAVLVFPTLFFPPGNPATATLQSLATFALAFFARPIGSAIFGHFGDRVGRKATLVAALLTMGLSTVAIGLLPTFDQVGLIAPALLALCRLGQGIGLGGEWGGAVLLATENAPPSKRAWYAMFPQVGAPIGFIGATGAFAILGLTLSDPDLLEWGWRLPFLASSLLVFVGLYVRLKIAETPAFQRAIDNNERVALPMATVLTGHTRTLILATGVGLITFVTFYTMTVFTLSWGTTKLGMPRQDFLLLQIVGMLFFATGIVVSSRLADRFGPQRMLIFATIAIAVFGLLFAPLFGGGSTLSVAVFLALGLLCLGLEYGPLGVALAQLFPTAIRYTGSSLAFNFSAILGGSLAPYIATSLAGNYGIAAVGYYMSVAALITLASLLVLGPKPFEGVEPTAVPDARR